jgi:restriction system protein
MVRGLKRVRRRRDDALTRIGWDRLETLLAEHYRREGYAVEHVGTGGSRRRFDGGIDLKLRRADEYVLVQSKHWNAYQVTHNAVHELLGVMVNQSATGAILVTSGEFTRAAAEAANRQGHVQLIDGVDLRRMLGQLDEPAPAPSRIAEYARQVSASPAARTIGGAIRDRLVNEAVQAARGRRGAGVTRSALAAGLGPIVLKLVITVVMLWVLAGAFTRLWTSFANSMSRAQEVTAPAPLPAPEVERAGLMPAATGSATKPPVESTRDPYRPPTDAEIRESQRKADAAMEILRDHTPEM